MSTRAERSDEPYLLETQSAFEEVDPSWIDITSLELWLYTCDKNHALTCRTVLRTAESVETRPQWLIDISRKCLTPAGPDDRYAALSYVWGGVSCSQATTANLSRLLEPGSLEAATDMFLPRTIRHVMGLLERLGIPYLWVDALCIVQDDLEVKRKQIHAMAWIYANAYVTIIAADGWDADHGLRGIRGVTEPRFLHGDSVREVQASLLSQSAIWYNRGWTFQEMIFSRRRIMFHNQVVLWECPAAAWNECRLNSIFTIPRWPVRVGLTACPDIPQYMLAVRSYNTRQFTYPEDALKAISSLLSTWRYSFDGGFISGLPQMFFYEALLWQPAETLQRRVPSNGSVADDDAHLPSWSWVGWEGSIDTESWLKHFSHLHLLQHNRKGSWVFQVMPTAPWFYVDPVHGMSEIRASSLTYRPCYRFRDEPVEGWEQVEMHPRPVWKYAGLDDTRTAYPLPLFCEPGNVVSASKLYTQTLRGYFRGRRRSLHKTDEFTLLDKSGSECGMLRLMLLPAGGSYGLDDGDEIMFELVEVAAGMTWDPKRVTKWGDFGQEILGDFSATPWEPEVKRIIYVLWIEWNENVAYRRGLGRITAATWDREYTDEIDLVLG
ncbi:hypothetical protein MFIFM68171_10103 [Madurella fahalii]|uniref:Heterokaryon incompatibility domain-containing protein n=1 Tax=Madurella fahalii TaxID=1157608 RepID=A0ABQ0GQA2_9PEZI